MHNKLITLGIETSCDETAVSIYNNFKGIISEYTYSQKIHHKYGGTVPELASRDHVKRLLNILMFTLKKTKIDLNQLNIISYTKGPGLNGPLLVGSTFSKTLGYSLNIPSIGINHLKAHITISLLFNKNIKFPCLVILISGAHTILIKMINYKIFNFLGETLDDGVGEVFDKIARSLNLMPMNGLSIEKICQFNSSFLNLKFPQSLSKSNCYNLSFSGLKTAVINTIKKYKNVYNFKSNIAYNFQNTVIKILLKKCKFIIKKNFIKSMLIVGGVSSNKELRLSFLNMSESLNINLYTVPIKYCTDNGSMVAFLGFIKSLEGYYEENLLLEIKPNLNI